MHDSSPLRFVLLTGRMGGHRRLAMIVSWAGLMLPLLVGAQIGVGQWQDQPNLTKCQAVAAVDGAPIALVAGETALFAVGLNDAGRSNGEIQRFGKSDGLSRAEISALALAPEWGQAVVGYDEGTFDLVEMDVDGTLGSVLSVRDLAEADLPGNKQPRALVVVSDRLLVCTDIGVVEYDLQALEVRDTWKLESEGQSLAVRDAALRAGRWWLATSEGVWSAPSDAAFPGNPATWVQDAELAALGVVDVYGIEVHSNGRIAVLERRSDASDALWLGDPGNANWLESSASLSEEWTGLYSDGNKLWATTPFAVMECDDAWMPAQIRTAAGSFFLQPNGAAAGAGGLWVANANYGAFWLDAGGNDAAFEGPIAPNGPRSNSALRMDAWNDRLWVATGGSGSQWCALVSPGRIQWPERKLLVVGGAAGWRSGRRWGSGPHGGQLGPHPTGAGRFWKLGRGTGGIGRSRADAVLESWELSAGMECELGNSEVCSPRA